MGISRASLRLVGASLWIVLLSGCAPAQSNTATSVSYPATVSPTPGPVLRVDAWHLDPVRGRALILTSLVSGSASSDVVLDIGLLNDQGQTVAHATSHLLDRFLFPTGQSFLVADFPPGSKGSDLRLQVVSSRDAPAGALALEATSLSADWQAGGVRALLGKLTGPPSSAVTVDSLLAVGLDQAGNPSAYALAAPGLDFLNSGEAIPFRADVPEAEGVAKWIVLAQGSTRGQPPFPQVEVEALQLQSDSQGNPFLSGYVINRSDEPLAARLLLLVKDGQEWLAAGILECPVPLPPHSRTAFSLDELPGLRLRRPQGAEAPPLEIVAYIADSPSQATLAELSPEVTGFEAIGSRLYLRGQLRNPGPHAVSSPTLFGSVYSSEGELISANWTLAGERVSSGETVPFLLTIALPKGADLALAEFEVKAVGIQE